jgi:prevent-host-death family protein
MVKQYSMAQAERDLSSVVEQAAAGAEVLLTQRGRLVAVIVSVERYAALKVRRGSFAEAFEAFRGKFPGAGLASRDFRALRDGQAGREVSL